MKLQAAAAAAAVVRGAVGEKRGLLRQRRLIDTFAPDDLSGPLVNTHTYVAHTHAAGITSGDAVMLELAAAEMAQAAALFVALEKEVEVLRVKGAEAGVIALKDTAR